MTDVQTRRAAAAGQLAQTARELRRTAADRLGDPASAVELLEIAERLDRIAERLGPPGPTGGDDGAPAGDAEPS